MLKKSILFCLLCLYVALVFAQTQHYGDLEVTLLGTEGIAVLAIDSDLEDTTLIYTQNSVAYFEDLYIYTEVGMHENSVRKNAFSGPVNIYKLNGELIAIVHAQADGSVVFGDEGNSHPYGLYLAADKHGTSQKFVYIGKKCMIVKTEGIASQPAEKLAASESNLYKIHADGREREWNPFELIIEEHLLFADIVNYVMMEYTFVPDAPASGLVTILVDGQPAGDNSELKLVRTGQADTSYFYTLNGIADFTALSHPFGNFTRDYTMIINSISANSNWFHAETHEVEIALGSGNDFVFNPAKITDAERTANITLEILISGTTPAAEDAEVKVFRLGETDTTFAYTNDQGIAQLDRLVHPFQADAHQFSINSDDCASNFFNPLIEEHEIRVGQNDIEMHPDSITGNFANGFVTVHDDNTAHPGIVVKVWKLSNTIDTNVYVTNAAGRFEYDNLVIIGDSSQYVFKSEKILNTELLISTDTFFLSPGYNDMLHIYLSHVPEYNHAEGIVRKFYDQDVLVEGVNMEIWERNADTLFGSCTTDADGYWQIDSIPLGFEAEIQMFGLSDHFNRFHDFDFPNDVLTPGEDSTITLNMLHVPVNMIIPQTANDPAPETVLADAYEVWEIAPHHALERNGEEIARQEALVYLTNPNTNRVALYNELVDVVDSLFYNGNPGPFVRVYQSINITYYHQSNYDIDVGFPGELGYNLSFGSGNNFTGISSTLETGAFTIGGDVNWTSGVAVGIHELHGHRLNLNHVGSRPSFMDGMTQTTIIPDQKDRAYVNAININQVARTLEDIETFDLTGLSLGKNKPERTRQELKNCAH